MLIDVPWAEAGVVTATEMVNARRAKTSAPRYGLCSSLSFFPLVYANPMVDLLYLVYNHFLATVSRT